MKLNNATTTQLQDVIRPHTCDEQTQLKLASLAEHLRRKNNIALGFLPFNTYKAAIARDRLLVCTENQDPCGILQWGRRRNRIKIHQTVVAHDSRRLLHASHLVAQVLAHPDAQDASLIQLRVAADLPAVQFWRAVGFRIVREVKGKAWRGRRIYVMQLRCKNRKRQAHRSLKKLLDAT